MITETSVRLAAHKALDKLLDIAFRDEKLTRSGIFDVSVTDNEDMSMIQGNTYTRYNAELIHHDQYGWQVEEITQDERRDSILSSSRSLKE